MKEGFKPSEQTFPNLDYLEFFTTPSGLEEEQTLMEQLPINKYDHAVVVGRFQPLHYGHLYLIKQALQVAKHVTIGIGSANIINKDNPFSPQERKYMLSKALKKEDIHHKIKNITFLNDHPDDEVWAERTVSKVGVVDVVVGNNEWVNNCFNLVGIPHLEVPLLQRGVYEGKKIREFLRSTGKLL